MSKKVSCDGGCKRNRNPFNILVELYTKWLMIIIRWYLPAIDDNIAAGIEHQQEVGDVSEKVAPNDLSDS